MNPKKSDAWPRYKQVRLVLIESSPWTAQPRQGLLVEWRRLGRGRWIALVAWVDEPVNQRPLLKVEWFPAELLTPIEADPNIVGAGEPPKW